MSQPWRTSGDRGLNTGTRFSSLFILCICSSGNHSIANLYIFNLVEELTTQLITIYLILFVGVLYYLVGLSTTQLHMWVYVLIFTSKTLCVVILMRVFTGSILFS